MEGRAVDISPMVSETQVLPSDGHMFALAWNLLLISYLLTLHTDQFSWVVEGDHIHAQWGGDPTAKHNDMIVCVPTLSSWYGLASSISEDPAPADRLLNRVLFIGVNEANQLIMLDATSAADDMIYYLEGNGAPLDAATSDKVEEQ